MDVILTQSPAGDGSKKTKNRRKKHSSKKQTVGKSGAEIINQMDDNLKASEETKDFEVTNHISENNILEAHITMQPLAESLNMDAGSTENLSEGKINRNKKKRLRKKNKKKSITEDETETAKTDAKPAENLAEENVISAKINRNKKKRLRKKKKKRKSITEDETESAKTDAKPTENLAEENVISAKTDAESTENLAKENVIGKRIKKANIKDEVQSMDQTKVDTGPTENLAEENATGKRKKKRKKTKKADMKDEVQSEDQNKLDTGPTENLAEENVIGKRKRKWKRIKKTNVKDELHSADQNKMDTGRQIENFAEGNVIGKIIDTGPVENFADGNVIDKGMDTGPVENSAEGNVIGKRKKRRKRNKNAKIKDEVQSVDQTKMDTGPIENLAEGNGTGKRKRKGKRSKKAKTVDEVQSMSQAASMSSLHLSDENYECSICSKGCGPLAKPMELDRKLFPCESQHGKFENWLSDMSNETKLNEQKGSSGGRGVVSACDVRVDAVCLNLKTAPITSIRRKLLVLDVNGLLADVVYPAPKHRRGDIHILGRAIFKRPFCDDFLKFCFQNFNVGIWSSRSKKLIDKVVDYLLGDLKDQLLFCWDMSHSTQTGFKTLENIHKPLVCKELQKIWENDAPDLTWKKGDYNESNTLLLDDSPYKALLNPLHTAIFPHSYCYEDKNDNSLGPKGDLRVYLEGLITSENVQKYVEQHPFGQGVINEQNMSWGFYTKVLQRMSDQSTDKTLRSVHTYF